MRKGIFGPPEDGKHLVVIQLATLLAAFLCVAIFGWFANQWFAKGVASSLDDRKSTVVADSKAVIPSSFLTRNVIAEIADRAGKSVVNIDIESAVAVADSDFGLPFKHFEYFFGGTDSPFKMTPETKREFRTRGNGSGVIIRADGFILTNNHVVQKADKIQVTLPDGRKLKGEVVGRDGFTDLALVKVDAKNLPVAKFGKSDKVKPGDWAIAIGNPMGLDHSVTFGIISALGRSLNEVGPNVELIQTDAAINPGNSGGPLLNIEGEIIGLNTAMKGNAQNIGFAIPIDIAANVVEQLLENGKIQRPFLGIYMQDMNEKMAKSLGVPASTKGVVVAQVAPDGPAAKSDLKIGDVIQKIDGKSVEDGKQVQAIVRAHKPGEKINMLLNRNGSLIASEVKIGDYPTEIEK